MNNLRAEGGCGCQHVQFEVNCAPLFRAFCHCTICQEFNQADFADIIVVRTKNVTQPEIGRIKFKNYNRLPIINRGRCAKCSGVAIETLSIPSLPRITIIPLQTLVRSTGVPEPLFHMFYHRRVKDANDDLPKLTNYIQSQWRFSSAVLTALMRMTAQQ